MDLSTLVRMIDGQLPLSFHSPCALLQKPACYSVYASVLWMPEVTYDLFISYYLSKKVRLMGLS